MTPDRPAAEAASAGEPVALSPITALFEKAGRLRRARVLHPRGRSFQGTFTNIDLLPEPGTSQVSVRISKATPTPAGWPDVLGIALRLPGPVDILFATTGHRAGLRHVLMPRGGFLDGIYTTLLPYEVAGETRMLALTPAAPPRRVPADVDELEQALPLTFTALAATLTGPWHRCGELRVERARDRDVPWFDVHEHSIPALHPAGPLQGIRRRAYAGSRRGRTARAVPGAESRTGEPDRKV